MKTNKKNSVLPIISISVVMSFLLQGLIFSQGTYKRFEFERAYVEKETKTTSPGAEITVKEKIYITENGNKMASYRTEKRNITMANIIEEERSVSINDGAWIIRYNPDTKEGTKMKFDANKNLSGKSEEEMKKYAEQMGNAMGTETKDIGTKEIAGKICKGTEAVTNMMGMKTTTTVWQYGGFTFGSVGGSMGTKFEEWVTKFVEGAVIDLQKLLVPSDVNIKEIKSP